MILAVACTTLALLITERPLVGQNNPATPVLQYGFALPRTQALARVEAIAQRLPSVPGEVLVKFRSGVQSSQQARALSVVRNGPSQMRWIGDVLLVRSESEPNTEVLAAILQAQPEVEWAQPNYMLALHAVPNDPSFNKQWNLSLINMSAAWDITGTRSSSVIVAVVDTGITATNNSQAFPLWTGSEISTFAIPFLINPDISGDRFTSSHDFVFWNGPVLDMVGHGTHVAGTILQETNNGLALAGIAPQARLMALKVCFGYWEMQIIRSAYGIPGFEPTESQGDCPTSEVVAAIRYAADNGAKVINLSLGGPQESPALLFAMRYAVQQGAFIAVSAGNDYEESNQANYPAAYAKGINGVMAVGAVNRSRRRAFYSNTGSKPEIVAPGGDQREGGVAGLIYQVGIFAPDFDTDAVIVPRFDRYYEDPKQGTSMASPHIAGLAVLLYAQGITNPAAIESAIKRSAVDLGPAGEDNEYGAGLIDARAALRGMGVAR